MTSAMTNSNAAKRKPVALNGVNTPALLATINAVGAQPELAKLQFRATNHWISGGITALPGLFVLGLTFLRRRRSPFIDGCGLDAEELAPIVNALLSGPAKQVA